MRQILLAALLATGIGLTAQAQTTTPEPTELSAVTASVSEPGLAAPARAATVLALATPPPAAMPSAAELGAPLPQSQKLAPMQTNGGLQTAQWILGIAGAVLALVVAISAANK